MSASTDNADTSAGLNVNQAASLLSAMPLEIEDQLAEAEQQPGNEPEGDEVDDLDPNADSDADSADDPDDDDPDADPDEDDDPDADPDEKPSQKLFEVPGLLDENGKPQKVTLDELRNGYLRHQDYTRKTQAVAETRKQAETELVSVRETRQRYSQALEHLDARIAQFEMSDAQLAQLKANDPLAWVEAVETRRQVREDRQRIAQEQQRVAEETAAEREAKTKEYVREQQAKLYEALPEWQKNPKVRERERAEILAAGLQLGFTEAELSSIADHRAVLLLRKAAKFDALQKTRQEAKPREARPPRGIAKPGSPNVAQPSKHRRAQADLARVKQTGRVQDAAAALLHFVDD